MENKINRKDYLIVHKSILPDYFDQVIKARDLIENSNYTVSDACKICFISRNTYYKYKDFVFIPSNKMGRKAIIIFKLEDIKGVLSNVLNFIASSLGNILAINQEMPINNNAYVTITIDCMELLGTIEDLCNSLRHLVGVKSVELLALE